MTCKDSYCKSLTNIVIQGTVTEIGNYVFDECVSLKTIYVPANKLSHYKKLLPKELHTLIVKQPAMKKAKHSPK